MWVTLHFLVWLIGLELAKEAAHAQWTPLDERYQTSGLRTVYIDPASIRRDEDLATVSVLIDWKSMQGGRSPARFFSTRVTKQFDCTHKRLRLSAFTDYWGHMGTGERISSGDSDGPWHVMEPDSVNAALWELVCKKS